MSEPKNLFVLFIFLFSFPLFSQIQTDENYAKISAVLDNYFDLEREAIHLHLDKTTFLNNESIWYQGYIINRKNNKPYFTTNVLVVLYDENGKQHSEKLIYASNGVFSGKIELSSKLDSGNYYIQVYTNWMNNFSENESTIIKINVINPTQGSNDHKKINPESLEIFLHPEGNSYVSGVSNTIGIQIKDCRGNSPENLEASIQNSSGEILKIIKLNRFGFGKFDIIPSTENIKVVVNTGNKILEKTLPKPDLIGVSIEANTFSIEGKTAIKIKTNKPSYDVFQSKKINLIVHQDQKLTFYPLQFKPNELEQTFLINDSDLHEGINTIRIIDSDLKQWAERLIYIKPVVKNNINVVNNNNGNSKTSLLGYSQYPSAIMSVSVLPEDTKSIDGNNSIIAGLTINPYLINPLPNANYYLNAPNRLKFYELDLVLLHNEASKYDWNLMKINTPASNYSFDIGISLRGAIDPSIKDKKSLKVNFITYKDFMVKSATVSEKGEYLFENLVLTDSTLINISLQRPPNLEEIKTRLTPQVINRKRLFSKPFKTQSCVDSNNYEPIAETDLPKLEGKIINLDAVVIKKEAASKKLVHNNILSNSMLKGFKIDDSNNHSSLLNFIENNGFNVLRNLGDIKITVRQKTSLNLPDQTPMVYINDRKLFGSYDEIEFMKMTEIEEIYIDAHAIVPSMNNNHGIIKIYTKKSKADFNRDNPNSFFIKEAFADRVSFKGENYQNTQGKGFDNYGLLGWITFLKSNENGEFLFDFIDYNKSKCKIIIEGMTNEGELFHEEKTVELK